MDKKLSAPVTSDSDIVKEPYKGPSVASAAAGEGYIAHFEWAGIGLVVGGLLSFVFHKNVNAFESGMRNFHSANRDSANFVMKWTSRSVGGIRSAAEFVTEHIPKKEWLKKQLSEPRYEATIFGGSLAGAFGFFVVPILLGVKGIQKGLAGRDQFERAKQEVLDQRAHNRVLRRYVNTLENQVVELESRTMNDGNLNVSKDEPLVTGEGTDATAVFHDAAHQKTAAADTPANTTPASEGDTKITAPAVSAVEMAKVEHKSQKAAWGDRMRSAQEIAGAQEAAIA